MLGASTALGDHLVANPAEWRALDRSDRAVDRHRRSPRLRRSGRRCGARRYRRALLRIAAADLTGAADVDATMAALSRLADATLPAAFALAGGDRETRLAVVAMGKCGGNELNYVSDVDVIFVCADDDDLGRAHAGRDPADADLRRRSPGRSTPRCAPRAAAARSSAPSPATSPTTGSGPAPGSSRRC